MASPRTDRSTPAAIALAAILAATAGTLGAQTSVLPSVARADEPGARGRRAEPIDARSPATRNIRPGLQLVEQVVAVIADAVILKSEIDRDVASLHQGVVAPEVLAAAERRVILDRLRSKIFAARAEAEVGASAPDQFQQRIDSIIDQRIYERERQLGGNARLRSDLARTGRSIEDLREVEELELLANYGQSIIVADLRDHGASVVTPRQMFAYFQENRDQFRQPASASYELIAIPLDGRRSDAADTFLKELDVVGDAWQAGETNVVEIRQKYGNTFFQRETLRQGEGTNDLAEQLAFGDDARPAGSVAVGRTTKYAYLIRLVKVTPAREPDFASDVVQDRIREILLERHHDQRQRESVERDVRKVAIYPPALEAQIHGGMTAQPRN